MQFNVAQLLKEPGGSSRTYELQDELRSALDGELLIVAPLMGRLRFLRAGQGILVTGQISTTLQVDCNRCLAPVDVPVTVELEEEFHPTLDIASGVELPADFEVEEANLINEQHVLDLSEVIRQELWLACPSLALCRENCKGFCLQCGQDLNEADCDCPEEIPDARWTGLQVLQLDDNH
ncbi:MAG: DUF177 domain-containing protein [Anaerolineae bacterium]